MHPDSLDIALSAARAAGVPSESVVLFDGSSPVPANRLTVGDLITRGLSSSDDNFVEKRLGPGEGKTKLAFLSFSSGTTGRPKVYLSRLPALVIITYQFDSQAVAIPHFSLIANVIQIAAHNKVNTDYCDFKDQRYRPGDVAIGGDTFVFVSLLYH